MRRSFCCLFSAHSAKQKEQMTALNVKPYKQAKSSVFELWISGSGVCSTSFWVCPLQWPQMIYIVWAFVGKIAAAYPPARRLSGLRPLYLFSSLRSSGYPDRSRCFISLTWYALSSVKEQGLVCDWLSEQRMATRQLANVDNTSHPLQKTASATDLSIPTAPENNKGVCSSSVPSHFTSILTALDKL